eukprot:m.43592 g.43592  ORF g.43592 m.43592 type:complete len:293 (+) comp33461_c0_seq1:779-1657(+)
MHHLMLARDNYFRKMTSSYAVDSEDKSSVWGESSRFRGTSDWAPPRPQIIFNIHPTLKRKNVMMKQNSRCAGCGLRVEPQHVKYFRYCEYTGKYFCSNCHVRKLHILPGKILHKWDFKQYPVSNHAHELLTRIFNDAIFDVAAVNRSLLRKVKGLAAATSAREQLHHLESFVKACRLADGFAPDFRSFNYLTSTPDYTLYSLRDLFLLNRGDLLPELKSLLLRALSHVDRCLVRSRARVFTRRCCDTLVEFLQLCRGRGFICEVCRNTEDVIFPFQTRKCVQCSGQYLASTG